MPNRPLFYLCVPDRFDRTYYHWAYMIHSRFQFSARHVGAGILAACAVAWAPGALAAPLDGLLTTHPEQFSKNGYVELGYDAMNGALDVLNLRDQDASLSGTNIGNYHGAHVRAGLALTPSLWLDGGVWQRKLDYRSDQVAIDTWQVAGQYRMLDGKGVVPALGLRLSAWGNRSGKLTKSSPTTVQGVTLDSISVSSPEDLQVQLDLVGSWNPGKAHEVTLLAGVGSSRVRVDEVTARDIQGGCLYDVVFGPTSVTGTLAQPCNANVVVNNFSVQNDTYGINVPLETQYNSTYAQLGLTYAWKSRRFMLRGGYTYQIFQRDYIDDAIRSRGGQAYEASHTLTGEITMLATKRIAVFLRGTAMSNQLLGEVPFAYNTLTAHRFDKVYGIVSAGLLVGF